MMYENCSCGSKSITVVEGNAICYGCYTKKVISQLPFPEYALETPSERRKRLS